MKINDKLKKHLLVRYVSNQKHWIEPHKNYTKINFKRGCLGQPESHLHYLFINEVSLELTEVLRQLQFYLLCTEVRFVVLC